ncbi:FG-GAP repeat domain-containing protein [Fodinicola feengrottensis]|uniref:FG-GAP repeat domain-containing protein n=1 Tax=Fodinicola feengrottensis TaxID=435914 RepID=UPI0013D537F4|nr:VCBS repeat-containing protein [Fodinicola feengrottensis]
MSTSPGVRPAAPPPVDLFQLPDLDPNAALDWDNTGGYWGSYLDERSAAAHNTTTPMSFLGDNLKNSVQAVANSRATSISLGLKAPNESGCNSASESQWKKFDPASAVMSITYNNPPRVPRGLNLVRPMPCGTATAPTAIDTASPQFAATGDDPDAGDSITTTLQILNSSGAVVYQDHVGPTVSGASFSWAPVPAATLGENTVYHYHAFTTDAVVQGPSTDDCYFLVDSVSPNVPQIQSTDYPNGSAVIPARTVGKVTFSPATGDTDVAAYNYGFSRDKVNERVNAATDGTATVPITVTPPTTGLPTARLYVQAVDRAGNVSDVSDGWLLVALRNSTVKHVRGDTNGDGKADVTAVFDQGFGSTSVWNVTSGGSGFVNGVMGWHSNEGGGFALYRTRTVQGDFDGDGKTDMAIFREGSGRQIWLYLLMSDGLGYNAMPYSWTSGPNGFPLSTARIVSGDVDGDGKTDLVVQNANADGTWQALVFLASNNFSPHRPTGACPRPAPPGRRAAR